MDIEERKVFERLLENTYVDEPVLTLDSEDVPADSWMRRNGFAYFPLFGETNRDNDGAYKMMTERYLLKYLGRGHRLQRVEDMYILKPYPAVDADGLVQSYIINRDQLRREGDRPWSEIGHERWLVRTLGSIRRRSNGELYYDDSADGRLDWVYEQATTAYENDASDPLSLPEDGWIWTALFARAIRAELDDPMLLTFGLRRLRGRYKLRIAATTEGLRLRGSAEATTLYRRMMDRYGAGDWLKEQMTEIKRCRGNGEDGIGEIAGIAAQFGGAGRAAASAVRAGDTDDGVA